MTKPFLFDHSSPNIMLRKFSGGVWNLGAQDYQFLPIWPDGKHYKIRHRHFALRANPAAAFEKF